MKILLLAFLVIMAARTSASADYDAAVKAMEQGKYQQALQELDPLLKRGDKDAQYLIGLMYLNGFGVKRNLERSIHYLRLSSNQGHEWARFLLGTALHANEEFVEAAEHYRWAADRGNSDAQVLLAVMYTAGIGVSQDMAEALRLYRAAADLGNPSALTKLGQFYYMGDVVNKDLAKSVHYLRMAAEKDEVQAQTLLGALLYGGEGTPPNPREAVSWWLKASRTGDPDADSHLGWAYHEGRGVPRDGQEALKWMQRGAEGGSAFGQLALGAFYRDGIYVQKDLVTALMWFRLSEAQEHEGSAEQINYTLQFMTQQQIDEADRLAKRRLSR